MTEAQWSSDALHTLAADRVVFLRDDSCSPRPAPPWLEAAAGEVLDEPVDELLARVHPGDAVAVTRSFLDAVVNPGSVVTVTARLAHPTPADWGHWELSWLNLLDHAEVGGVLGMLQAVDGDEIEPPVVDDRAAFHATDWVLLTYGDDGATIAAAEGAVTELLGYEPDELVGKMPVHFADERDLGSAVTAWSRVRSAGKVGPGTATSERRWVRKDGSRVWVESSYLTRRTPDGRVENLCIVWDISARRAQQEALERSEVENRRLVEEFRLLADEVPAAVFRCDADGRVTFHNARWREMFGAGEAAAHVHDALSKQDRPALDDLLRRLTTTSRAEAVTLEATANDGCRTLAIRFRTLAGDEGGTRIVGSITDITATVELRQRADHDPLTGLLTRNVLDAHLAGKLDDPSRRVAVAFIDLDGFKGVNDTYGHDAGDAVLIEVANRLSSVVRPQDAVGRWGGDEFVVVVADATGTTPVNVTARIEDALQEPVELGVVRWAVRSSIGWATSEPEDDVAALIQRADAAMFAVKRCRRTPR